MEGHTPNGVGDSKPTLDLDISSIGDAEDIIATSQMLWRGTSQTILSTAPTPPPHPNPLPPLNRNPAQPPTHQPNPPTAPARPPPPTPPPPPPPPPPHTHTHTPLIFLLQLMLTMHPPHMPDIPRYTMEIHILILTQMLRSVMSRMFYCLSTAMPI